MSDTQIPEPTATEPPAQPPAQPPAEPVPTAPLTPPPAPPKAGIALAALIVGIVAALFAVIPGPSFGAFVPAILAAVLGVVALTRKTPRRGFAWAGVILGAVSLLVATIVSIVAIVAGAGLASHSSSLGDGSGSGQGSNSSTAAEPTPTQVPTQVPIPADVVLSGRGDAVIKASAIDGADQPGVATFTHDGSGNFAVWSLDANVNQLDLLVNTIGAYNGTVLFDKQSTQHTESLQITADGNWTVTLHSIRALRSFDTTTTGHGDDVLIYRGNAGAATISHDGSSNFAIWTYGDQTNLVVNEIGAYNGTVRWAKGAELVTVTADGNWSIKVG